VKTRDRILVTSLQLFNEEGEANITTLDIANAMDISPGNLYYHFKGKDEIIAELFHQFELALGHTLKAPIEKPLGSETGHVEDNWFYLYVLMEEMYHYRFLYQSLDDILQRYSLLQRRFNRLLQLKRLALATICDTLIAQSVMRPKTKQAEGLVNNLVENLAQTLTFWFSWSHLSYGSRPPQVVIHQGVLQLMSLIAPYLGDGQLDFYHQCQSMYQSMLESTA